MKMNRLIPKSAVVFLLMLLALSSCLQNDLRIISEINNQFQNITEIEVHGGFLAVSYEGAESNVDVTLDALLRANSESKYRIDYQVIDTKLVIQLSHVGGSWGNFRSDGYIRLTGPKTMELDLSVDSGSLTVNQVTGSNPRFSASSGEIRLSGISGNEMVLNMSSGNIVGSDIVSDIIARNSSGRIVLERVTGDIEVKASSGNISLSDIEGLVNTEVSSGKIELSRVKSLGLGHVSSGRLIGSHIGLNPNTDLKASSGNIYIQTFSDFRGFNFDLSAGSGRVRVGDSQSSGHLVIDNGSPYTIHGSVGSGKIEIVN